jgi:hypothetical protein
LFFKGPALSKALAEIVEKRPSDPIEFLANYLYKYADNKRHEKKVRLSSLNYRI